MPAGLRHECVVGQRLPEQGLAPELAERKKNQARLFLLLGAQPGYPFLLIKKLAWRPNRALLVREKQTWSRPTCRNKASVQCQTQSVATRIFSISFPFIITFVPLAPGSILRPQPKGPERLDEILRFMLLQRSWFPQDGLSQGAAPGSLPSTSNVDVTRRREYEFFAKRSVRASGVENLASEERLEKPVRLEDGPPGGRASPTANISVKTAATRAEGTAKETTFEDCLPDVFLFASNTGQGYQARFVDERLFVSPGHASRLNSTGTFVEMWLHPGQKELARVEIRKLP